MTRFEISRRSFLGGAAAVPLVTAFPTRGVRAASSRKLVFWHSYTQAERVKAMQALASSFEAENPGVKVEIEVVPWPAFTQKWPAALAGGTLPDVAIMLAENAVPMHLAGALNPMDDVVHELGGTAAFSPNLLNATGRFNGQYISVPHYVHNRILIYRKDRLAEAGVKVPVTWDDALNAAVATTKAPDHFGWILKLAKGDVGASNLLWVLTRSAGGSFFDAKGEVTFDSEPVREAARYMAEIARRTSGPGVTEYKINDNYALVNSGKTSLTEDSAAVVAVAAKDAPDVGELLDATFMPRKTQVGNMTAAISVGLPKGQNPEDAKRFVAKMFSDEHYVPFLHSIPLFMFPSLAKSAAGFYDQPLIQRYRNVVDVTLEGIANGSLAGMEHGLNPYASPVWASNTIEDMMQRILLNNEPVEQAVSATAGNMATIINDIRTRFGEAE